MSAAPASVTGVHDPVKEPHVPPASVVASRSTIPLAASTPAPGSAPESRVTGTDAAVTQPPVTVADMPVGAVVSRTKAGVSVVWFPAPSTTVTVSDGAVVLALVNE